MNPATERQRYIVTSSLIGWAHAQNDPWHILLPIAGSPSCFLITGAVTVYCL